MAHYEVLMLSAVIVLAMLAIKYFYGYGSFRFALSFFVIIGKTIARVHITSRKLFTQKRPKTVLSKM
jgi:hypothetical protein